MRHPKHGLSPITFGRTAPSASSIDETSQAKRFAGNNPLFFAPRKTMGPRASTRMCRNCNLLLNHARSMVVDR